MAKSTSGIVVMKATESRKLIHEDDLMIICRAWEKYEGSTEVIESAIGALIVGRLAGYDALRMVHSWKTLKNYEEKLGVSFKEILNATTPDTDRIGGIRRAKKFKALWRALAAGVGSEPGARDLSVE